MDQPSTDGMDVFLVQGSSGLIILSGVHVRDEFLRALEVYVPRLTLNDQADAVFRLGNAAVRNSNLTKGGFLFSGVGDFMA
ncbi:unnamed protein product [Echinostoma caproni]|uniref:NAGPA domain-containing protein n=1 Tax=Echinostoma caproni TaxID=27848 RepID=A0A183AJJ5_9TREM|nr:unnamed protein product [Echinostoma caproni]